MANENDPDPIETPEPESAPGPEKSQERRPSDRRDFLLRLATMSFLTAAVLRGAIPASAAEGDAACGAIQTGQLVHHDVDCEPGPVEAGMQDQDCGLPNGNGWHTHRDNDCSSQSVIDDLELEGTFSDSDCGRIKGGTGPFYSHHTDHVCAPATQENPLAPPDLDCASISGSGGVHDDNDCQPLGPLAQYQDLDCGFLSNGGRHSDHDCTPPGGANPSVDTDCGMSMGLGLTGQQEDSHCAPGNLDVDCGLGLQGAVIGAHRDQDCGPPQGGGGGFSEDSDCGRRVGLGEGGILGPRDHQDNDCHVPQGGGPTTDNPAP